MGRYIADFLAPSANLVGKVEGTARTAARLGFAVLRVSRDAVMNQLKAARLAAAGARTGALSALAQRLLASFEELCILCVTPKVTHPR